MDQEGGEDGVDVEVAGCEKPLRTGERGGTGEETEDGCDCWVFG